MKAKLSTLVLILLAMLNANLLSAQVKSDYDKEVDFSTIKSYTFKGWAKDSDQVLNDLPVALSIIVVVHETCQRKLHGSAWDPGRRINDVAGQHWIGDVVLQDSRFGEIPIDNASDFDFPFGVVLDVEFPLVVPLIIVLAGFFLAAGKTAIRLVVNRETGLSVKPVGQP